MISQKNYFFYNNSSNLNISITMAYTVFTFCFLILHTHSEGTMSQIYNLGPSSFIHYDIKNDHTKFENFIYNIN